MSISVLVHPLAAHLLTKLRSIETDPHQFRQSARLLSTLLILKATEHLPVSSVLISTPLEQMKSSVLSARMAVVPILRAGLSMLEPALELFPDVAVGYIGLERSHETAVASSYYSKLPALTGRHVFCVDPMLATGGSAAQAITLLKAANPETVNFVCVVAAPEGIAALTAAHPDIHITTAAIDRELSEKRYILPGLGDYGDRLYGTE